MEIHWLTSQVQCMGESAVKSKRNKFNLMLTWALVLVSFWLVFYFNYIIKTFKECRLSPFNFQTQSISTRNGFSRLPQCVEVIMKNSLLKLAKALKTGMKMKWWYLFSLFIYPLLKPHEGPGDFLARSNIAKGRFIGTEGSDMQQSRSAHFLQHEVQTEIWLCLFIWNVFLSDSLLWVCKELGFGLEGVSI